MPKPTIELIHAWDEAEVIAWPEPRELGEPRVLVRRKGQNCQSDCEMAWTQGLPGIATRAFYHYWNGAVRETERNEPRLHPTQKPVALMRWCMSLFPEARTVIDPYMGVGTTLVAAKQLGLQAIGIELDEKYCRHAADRVECATRLLS